ncbi:putative damage-inducible protein DinB [Phycicoccus badiiscoriae]|uniref:Putative damage-inducible protein DinB n=1 Tax=Pedococcus badiiscoriae TaxID=642776 RepID=A0A852WLU5_9MICO|nr:DinB family protein [Pedococcus badiiscoriae]NYG06426.1 putative damage-inducible protein DinB [Pedococcus badiiscoriae]
MTLQPYTADEKSVLLAALRSHRDVMLWKLEGLSDEEVRRPMVPSGTNLLGLVKHLANAEYGWFCETFGRPTEPLTDISQDPEADMRAAAGETTEEIVAFYRRAAAASDAAIHELALEDTGTAYTGRTVSLRWVLVHMIEDTVRHAGHADILRELIDGGTGHHVPR